MYESFYHLREKPFTLLPDPEFLYLSNKHRMALTLLEYGLMNQAGFTIISGEIGAGKTTLIRHLLNNMDREHTVGLISNTHRDFGELLQWILLAFNLEHKNMDKVDMYQRFVEFIIDEYAHNRRTVLIVDEAQNMAAETLEELRMLSNINADKDQSLQVILVGQRELRHTLRRPDLIQFAQRISVDYHLESLSAEETIGYIRHRMEVAGGDPNTFTEAACLAAHRYSNGVPRLINLLCDTALVYGYAEQEHKIDAALVTDVAREKQQGGIFPTFQSAVSETPDQSDTDSAVLQTVDMDSSEPNPSPAGTTHDPVQNRNESVTEVMADTSRELDTPQRKVRLALCSTQEGLLNYLSRLLAIEGFAIVDAALLDASHLAALTPDRFDLLLIDREEGAEYESPEVTDVLAHWSGPLLYNNSAATELSLRNGNPGFGKLLTKNILALVSESRTGVTATGHRY